MAKFIPSLAPLHSHLGRHFQRDNAPCHESSSTGSRSFHCSGSLQGFQGLTLSTILWIGREQLFALRLCKLSNVRRLYDAIVSKWFSVSTTDGESGPPEKKKIHAPDEFTLLLTPKEVPQE